MILERFDAVVFIGDDLMKHVYAAFNMFLRQDLAIGSLKQWEMTEADRDLCKCDNQITRPECAKYSIGNSEDLKKNDHGSGHTSSYYCDRRAHSHRHVARILTRFNRYSALPPADHNVSRP